MKHRFRKQFIFAPSELFGEQFEKWPTKKIGEHLLKWHPAMGCASASADGRNIFLLGTALHGEQPDWKEEEIARHLAESPSNNELLDRLDLLCGTYVIIEQTSKHARFYNDVSSSGKIFYTAQADGTVLGSDPRIISKLVELSGDDSPEAHAFYESDFFKKAGYRQWMGNRTRYADVFQVLPNHSFDLGKNEVFRYYPRKLRTERPVDEIFREASRILKNLNAAVFYRDDAFISLTAGWDSRVIMAATRDFAEHATYYTFQYSGSGVNDKDVEVAQKICGDLGLKHEIIHPNSSLPAIYADDIIGSFELRNDRRYHGFLKLFDNQLSDKYAVTGSISEIAKNYFERLPIETGAELASVAHYPGETYCIRYFQEWIDESKTLIERFGYTPQDFAHWEQDIANFAGAGILNSSFVANRISPFNCRKLIDLILSADIEYRDGYNNVVYRGIIQTLWPELLNYPVNPTLKVRLINWAKRIGIYSTYRRLRHRFL